MKKSIIIISTLILGIFLQACDKEIIKPSSEIVTKEYDFSKFTSLDVANDFKVYVNFSDEAEKVSVEVNENLMEHVVVGMNNGILEIRLKNNVNINGKETLNAYVSAAMINDFQASGDVEIFLQDKLATKNVSIKLSGDSKFDGVLETTSLNANLKGDSYLTLVGSADSLDINLSGDSKIERYDFTVKNLKIDLKGDSEGYLSVTESIDIKARGDSNLYYKGDATIINEDLSGDSKLIKED